MILIEVLSEKKIDRPQGISYLEQISSSQAAGMASIMLESSFWQDKLHFCMFCDLKGFSQGNHTLSDTYRGSFRKKLDRPQGISNLEQISSSQAVGMAPIMLE